MSFREQSPSSYGAQIIQVEAVKSSDSIESSGVISSVERARRKLAEAHGTFYQMLVDEYLSGRPEEVRRERLASNLLMLPLPVRDLYREGLMRLEEEIKTNARNISYIEKDQVIPTLLLSRMDEVEIDDGQKDEVLKKAETSVRLVQPLPGVAILEVEPDFFLLLKKVGLVRKRAHAIYSKARKRDEIGFMLVQGDGIFRLSDEGVRRHELSHMILDFLRRGEFLRKPETTSGFSKKVSDNRIEAFYMFRDEAVAYLVDPRRFESVDQSYLVHSKNSRMLKLAGDTRDFASLCMKAASETTESDSFIYAALTSRNFEDFKQKFLAFVPKREKIKGNLFAYMMRMSGRGERVMGVIADFWRQSEIVASQDSLKDYCSETLNGLDNHVDLIDQLSRLEKFLTNLGLAMPFWGQLFFQHQERIRRMVTANYDVNSSARRELLTSVTLTVRSNKAPTTTT